MGTESDPSVLASIGQVVQRVLQDDANLVESLRAVAGAGCSLLGGCDAASITIIQNGRPSTIASTSDIAVAVDQAQYETGEGPCLTAARDQQVIHLARIDDAGERWPTWVESAERLGVASSLSVPLVMPGPDTFGGLNLYAQKPDAFDPDDQQIAGAFAGQASAVVSNVIAYWAVLEQSQQLAAAMASRAVIEQAKGILMAAQHCTADEAFDLLRRASQRENRKLREIATDIVARASTVEEPE